MIKRKSISKKQRQIVYERYDGHCAYCGCDLDIKDMQVDHVNSLYRESQKRNPSSEALHDIDNFLPACRMCNFYKGTYTLNQFREKLLDTLFKNLEKTFQFRLAEQYGLVTKNKHDIVFYFEQQKVKLKEKKL